MNTTKILFIITCLGTFAYGTAQASMSAYAGPTLPVCNSEHDTDSEAAQWQKEHALYLHDLQISSFEQKDKPVPTNGYDVADDLLDASLYVAYAETDRLMLDNPHNARNDLKQALNKMDEAYSLADDVEKSKIKMVKKEVLTTRDAIDTCLGAESAKQRDHYDMLRKNIGELVKDYS